MSSEEVGDLLMALWRRWKSASPVSRGAVTQEQYWILKTLSDTGPMKIKDLAARLGITPGSASVTVKRMKRDGLLEGERNQDDERVVTVRVAGKGHQRLRSWRREQLRSVAALFDALNPAELNDLVRLLEKGLAGTDRTARAGSRGAR